MPSLESLTLSVSVAAVMALCAPLLARARPLALVLTGPRGGQRRRALARSATFRAVDPLLRWGGARLAPLVPPERLLPLDSALLRAGYFLGLEAIELVTLSGLAGLTFAAGALAADLAAYAVPLGLLGALLPGASVREETARRAREMSRGLPAAIDLVSLCVGAGLDFPRALRFVAREPGRRTLVEEELALVLCDLSLGRTRAAALAAFAERTPVEAVRSLAAAVIAADEKGSPLSEVLRIQAAVLRGRRGVLAEEAAARAGVLLLLPLLLLLACVLLLLFAPFLLGEGLGGR